MTLKRILTLLLILLLSLSLAGCGEDEPAETPTPRAEQSAATNTPAPPTNTPVPPTNTPVPAAADPTAEATASPVPEADSQTSSLFEAPNLALDSYRARGQFLITTTYQDNTTAVQNMVLEGVFVRSDNAYGGDESFQMRMVDGEDVEDIAIYKVGEWVSVNSQGEWMTVGRDNAGLFTGMSDLFTGFVDQFVMEQNDATNLGTESVNGQSATHYRIDNIDIFQRMAQIQPDSEEVIESVAMDVWVATEGNYVIKYNIQASVSNVTETNESGAEVVVAQSVEWSYEIFDINESITITLPADAPEPGVVVIPGFADGAFPLPEGGKLATNMIGMPEITSELSQEELVEFYTESFTALGWEFTGDFGFYEAAKDGVSFSMFFDTNEEGKGRAQIFAN